MCRVTGKKRHLSRHSRSNRGLSDGFMPNRAVLRECGPFGEGRREIEELEVAFEGPADSNLVAAGDARCPHPRKQKLLGKAALGMGATCSAQRNVRLAMWCYNSNAPVRCCRFLQVVRWTYVWHMAGH